MRQLTNLLMFLVVILFPFDTLYAQSPDLGDLKYPIIRSSGCLRSLGSTPIPIPMTIPVGCEAVDCCPGCQDGLIDWKIRARGIGDRTLTIKFENLDADRSKRLVAEGYGNWITPDTLNLKDGETIVRGIGYSGQQVVPVATPNFTLDQKSVKLLERAIAERRRAKVEPVEVVVEIDQMLGPVIVSSQKLELTHLDCMKLPPRFTTDAVQLINNRGSDESGVWIRAAIEAGVCLRDFPVCVTSSKPLPNFQFPCSGNYFAFSEDDAMVWRRQSWTPAEGDVLSIRFGDLLNVPLQVWLVAANKLEIAQIEVALTNMVFNKQHCGMRFSPIYVDLSNQPKAITIEENPSDNSIRKCSKLRSDIGFQEGAINVYYLTQTAFGVPYACDEGDQIGEPGEPMVVIGGTKTNESLMHEIGHVFSLAHPAQYTPSEGANTLPCNNIMQTQGNACPAAGGPRRTFTEGQCFRMNADEISWINKLGIRQGSTKSCWLGVGGSSITIPTDPFCPSISSNIDHPDPGLQIQLQLPPDLSNLCGPGIPLSVLE